MTTFSLGDHGITKPMVQRNLSVAQQQEDKSLERLSTGLKINSGADDPAGLIASENLKNQQAGIQQAIDNAGQAGNMIGTAEGGLNEVSNLLTQLTSLVNQSANSWAGQADFTYYPLLQRDDGNAD